MTTTIIEEEAIAFDNLPKIWQDISTNSVKTGITDKQAYIEMAQLFAAKFHFGDVDLFNKTTEFGENKDSFIALFSKLADETLEYFGNDFLISSYPNFDEIQQELDSSNPEYKDKQNIVQIAKDLFNEFKYDFPALFYWVHLAPLSRSEVREIRPLRFSESDKQNARAWDANLHGQKVFPIQMKIQSISSKYGFVWEHGCGCNHGLSRVGKIDEQFTYNLKPEMKKTWMRDFVWTVWYEYAFSMFTPVTQYLTGKIVEFEQ